MWNTVFPLILRLEKFQSKIPNFIFHPVHLDVGLF